MATTYEDLPDVIRARIFEIRTAMIHAAATVFQKFTRGRVPYLVMKSTQLKYRYHHYQGIGQLGGFNELHADTWERQTDTRRRTGEPTNQYWDSDHLVQSRAQSRAEGRRHYREKLREAFFYKWRTKWIRLSGSSGWKRIAIGPGAYIPKRRGPSARIAKRRRLS